METKSKILIIHLVWTEKTFFPLFIYLLAQRMNKGFIMNMNKSLHCKLNINSNSFQKLVYKPLKPPARMPGRPMANSKDKAEERQSRGPTVLSKDSEVGPENYQQLSIQAYSGLEISWSSLEFTCGPLLRGPKIYWFLHTSPLSSFWRCIWVPVEKTNNMISSPEHSSYYTGTDSVMDIVEEILVF